MCEIISVAVEPVTLEVFWAPGVEHHSELCDLKGLRYDRMFKPDIHLRTKEIAFHDGGIAVRRNVPPELLSELLRTPGFRQSHDGILFNWTDKHELTVRQWMARHIPDHERLIGFSDHSWNPRHYAGTTTAGIFADALPRISNISDSDNELLHEAWRRDFEKKELRSEVWQ